MILIADSGSTKTEWRLINNKKITTFKGQGINPLFLNKEEILKELKKLKFDELKEDLKEIYFYGAGLATETSKDKTKRIFKLFFGVNVKITIDDDLLAASRALFKNESGMACILGTGSNSCIYKNGEVIDKVPALGYILGDEGSGSDIGKRLINSLLKRDINTELTKKISLQNSISIQEIITNVYQQPLANRYLASMAKIVKTYEHEDEVREIVFSAFRSFIRKNIKKYENYYQYKIGFVGSIAFQFRDILEEVMQEEGISPYKIIEKPIEELANYHLEN